VALTQLMQYRVTRPTVGLDKLLEEANRVPHLAEYLNRIVPEVGWPDYYEGKLPGELKKMPNVNVIYPIGDNLYIHVYMPPGGTVSGYRKYVVIEPPRPPRALIELVEEKIAELVTERDVSRDEEERKKLLLKFLEQSVDVVDTPVNYNELLLRKRMGKLKLKKVPVYSRDYNILRYYLIRDKVGLGVLEPFIKDMYIEDISCDGVGYIYIVHKVFGPLETSVEFKTEEELDRFVIELSERIGKPVSHARPIVDATLPDGSRINIVFGTDVSLKGSNFTIRKFSKVPASVIQLIKWGTLDETVAAYLWMLLLEGMSGFISGETASGKTTSLNAIIAFIKPTAKIITIEDTAEVQVPHDNWVRELTRDTGSVESSVTMFDLLKAALRQRPNYIIVGEIRGAEGNVAFQAMQSVSWDTPILVKNVETGEIELTPIGKFIDQFYSEDEEKTPKYINKYLILSMDKYGKVKWSKINYVLRHKALEIYEILYEGKGVLKATGSHSVFVLDEDTLEIKPKYVSELRKGDLLVTFVKRNRVKSSLRKISVYNTLKDVGINVKFTDRKYVETSGRSKHLRSKLVLNENLAFLLGTYLADGCVEERSGKNPVISLSLGSSEKEFISKITSIAKDLNATITVKDRGSYSRARIYNAPLAYLIKHIAGRKLQGKHVPYELFESPAPIIKEFFRGLMADARRTNAREGIVVYTTKSRELAKQLVWLARLAGLESKIFEINDRRYGKYYDVRVRLFETRGIRLWSERIPLKPIIKIIKANNLETKLPPELTYIMRRYDEGRQRFVFRRTARKILEFLEKYREKLDKNSREILSRLKILLESDTAFLKVLNIRKTKYEGYVYDVSVPETELFIGGDVPVALHNTGHPVLATFHAGSVVRLIQRITSPPINVPKTQLDNLNFVIIQSAVYREGVMLRRMLSVNEIIGYDANADSIIYIPVFTWDPANDRFLFRGKGSSYLLEEKIATMRGISRRQLRLIYEELELRAQILREMKEKNIVDYYDVFRLFAKIFNIIDEKAKAMKKKEGTQYAVLEGLEEALRKIRAGELR